MNSNLPKIGVVIIGVNVEKYISTCISSVKECAYPQDLIEIVYVDGGSTDNSIRIARDFKDINVIELNDIHPTPGRGRNSGWKSLNADLIQFLDGDTILHPDWFKVAVPKLNGNTGAVCGHRREKYPDKNLYHFITDIEWGYNLGVCEYFGGDVLIIRDVLEKASGYDNDLIAGEDPELSYRIRQMKLNILRIDAPMTTHDINMSTIKAYIKRAYRSGYGYTEICLRYIHNKEKIWVKENIRIITRSFLPFFIVLAGLLTGYLLISVIFAILIIFRPLFSIHKFKKNHKLTSKQTVLYMVHIILVIYPQFLGIMRYFWAQITGNPLKNKIH